MLLTHPYFASYFLIGEISSMFWFAQPNELLMNFQPSDGHYSVGDFMTRKEDLHVVKTTTKVGEGTSGFASLVFKLKKHMENIFLITLTVKMLIILFSFISAIWSAALEMLVEKRVTGLPVVDDDWKLVIPLRLLP